MAKEIVACFDFPSVKYSMIFTAFRSMISRKVFSSKKGEICQGFGEEEKMNLRSSPPSLSGLPTSALISGSGWWCVQVGINRDWVGFIAKPRVAHLRTGPVAD